MKCNKTHDEKISVFVVSKDGQILVLKTNPKMYSNTYWSIINGGVDNDESFEEAALREVEEETGIKLEKMFYSDYSCVYEYPKGNIRTKKVFVGLTKTKEVKISHEHVEFKWLELANFTKEFSWPDPKEELNKILNKISNYLKQNN